MPTQTKMSANSVQSTQILCTLSQGPWAETRQIFEEPESELGEAFATLKSLFNTTKKIYSKKPFLSADNLNVRDTQSRTTIQITNLATFACYILGGIEVSLYELNDNFINAWAPPDETLSQDLGDLFLSLKTQVFLSELSQDEPEGTKEETLERLFPGGLSELLGGRPLDVPSVVTEPEFAQSARDRREYLHREPVDAESIREYPFVRDWARLTIHRVFVGAILVG